MFTSGLSGTTYAGVPDDGIVDPLVTFSCKCSTHHDLIMNCSFRVRDPVPYLIFGLREPPSQFLEVQHNFDEFLVFLSNQLLYFIDGTGHVYITNQSVLIVGEIVTVSPKHLY